jgi:hypothetical protein
VQITIRSQACKFIYLFTHQIANRGSISSRQISEHLSDSSNQSSIPNQDDFSWPQQARNINSIPNEPVNSFSSEQNSVFRQKIPLFTQRVSNKRSSSGLSQDIIATIQQFNSQETITEPQVYTPRYPLQDNFSIYFVDADVANRAQNEIPLNKIEKCSILVQLWEL